MRRRNRVLDLLRMELRAAQERHRALEVEAEGSKARRKAAEYFGAADAAFLALQDETASGRLDALRMNEALTERLRAQIAELLAHEPETVSAPVRARSDDAALMDLLESVGCRMPAGGVR